MVAPAVVAPAVATLDVVSLDAVVGIVAVIPAAVRSPGVAPGVHPEAARSG